MLSPEHEVLLGTLGKPQLLEEAILMRHQLFSQRSLEPMITAMFNKVIDLSVQVGNLNSLYQELKTSNVDLQHKVKKLLKQNKSLSNTCDDMSDEIYYMQKDISRIDQYSRRANIEISGIPTTVQDKDLETKVLDIFDKIGVVVTSYDIVAVHRLKIQKGQKFPNIIVRFFNRNKAYELLKNKKVLANFKKELPFVFLHDNLCPGYKSIYDECLHKKRIGEIDSVWSHHGTVHIKPAESDKPIKLFHVSDIEEHCYENQHNISDFDEFNDGWDPRHDWGTKN